MFYHT